MLEGVVLVFFCLGVVGVFFFFFNFFSRVGSAAWGPGLGTTLCGSGLV